MSSTTQMAGLVFAAFVAGFVAQASLNGIAHATARVEPSRTVVREVARDDGAFAASSPVLSDAPIGMPKAPDTSQSIETPPSFNERRARLRALRRALVEIAAPVDDVREASCIIAGLI